MVDVGERNNVSNPWTYVSVKTLRNLLTDDMHFPVTNEDQLIVGECKRITWYTKDSEPKRKILKIGELAANTPPNWKEDAIEIIDDLLENDMKEFEKKPGNS